MKTWRGHFFECTVNEVHPGIQALSKPLAYPRIAINIFKVSETCHTTPDSSSLFSTATFGLLLRWFWLLFTEVDVVGDLIEASVSARSYIPCWPSLLCHAQAGSSHWHLLEADFEIPLAELRVVGEGFIDKQLLVHVYLGFQAGMAKVHGWGKRGQKQEGMKSGQDFG